MNVSIFRESSDFTDHEWGPGILRKLKYWRNGKLLNLRSRANVVALKSNKQYITILGSSFEPVASEICFWVTWYTGTAHAGFKREWINFSSKISLAVLYFEVRLLQSGLEMMRNLLAFLLIVAHAEAENLEFFVDYSQMAFVLKNKPFLENYLPLPPTWLVDNFQRTFIIFLHDSSEKIKSVVIFSAFPFHLRICSKALGKKRSGF